MKHPYHPYDELTWARLERPATGSWMTVCLHSCGLNIVPIVIKLHFAEDGWELVQYGIGCPDTEPPQFFPEKDWIK